MDSSYGHQGSCYGSSVSSLKVFELFDVPFRCDEIWKGRKKKFGKWRIRTPIYTLKKYIIYYIILI